MNKEEQYLSSKSKIHAKVGKRTCIERRDKGTTRTFSWSELTFFPEEHLTMSSSPLTSKTSPSTQATSGSSTQTSDPTAILGGDACQNNLYSQACIRLLSPWNNSTKETPSQNNYVGCSSINLGYASQPEKTLLQQTFINSDALSWLQICNWK